MTTKIVGNGKRHIVNVNYYHEHYQIMLTIACRDVGQPCDCVLSGETEEELLKTRQNMLSMIMVTKKRK